MLRRDKHVCLPLVQDKQMQEYQKGSISQGVKEKGKRLLHINALFGYLKGIYKGKKGIACN